MECVERMSLNLFDLEKCRVLHLAGVPHEGNARVSMSSVTCRSEHVVHLLVHTNVCI